MAEVGKRDGDKDETLVSHCFKTIAKQDISQELEVWGKELTCSDQDLKYIPNENNTINQKST